MLGSIFKAFSGLTSASKRFQNSANNLSNLQTSGLIRFGEETEDEVFISHEAAAAGVEIENTGSEALVGLRYFGPDMHDNLPEMGAYKN